MVRMVRERICKTIKKEVTFEKSGETLSVELRLENVSPDIKKEKITQLLDELYVETKNAIF